MLQPNKNRLDYGSLLMPPEGFKIDHAIATTYSLDLDALVSIPVALYFAHSLDLDVSRDVVQVLDSIRRAASTVRVFCQKGQIAKPDNQHRLYGIIEPCIVQVSPSHKHSFHPKIWVIRFTNDHKEIVYRLIVLSRNLTFDRSWDVAFQIDGVCAGDRTNNFTKAKPLVDFIAHLSTYEKISWLKQFLNDLGKTEFKLTGNEFEDFQLMPSGFDRYRKTSMFGRLNYDEMLIISPFVTNGGLQIARDSCYSKPVLFSRKEEMQGINREILKEFTAFNLLKKYVEGEEKYEADSQEASYPLMQDLHAKVYCVKRGWNASLFLGSLNCSGRAMDSNVEFMIELKGKNVKIGPKVMLQDLINDDLKVFEPFTYSDEINEEKITELNEQILHRFKIDLVNAPLKCFAIKQEDGNFRIDFDLNLKSISTDARIQSEVHLLRSETQKHLIKAEARNNWSVHNVAELDLSCFLIFDVRLAGTGSAVQFAIKVDIADLPESRSSSIFRDIISNTSNFLKYVRFLLADDFWDEQLAFDASKGKNSADAWRQVFGGDEPIYENMLKAISRQPEKLIEIEKVMNKLASEEDGSEPIIPKEFLELWQVFKSVKK